MCKRRQRRSCTHSSETPARRAPATTMQRASENRVWRKETTKRKENSSNFDQQSGTKIRMVQFFVNCRRSWFDFENFARAAFSCSDRVRERRVRFGSVYTNRLVFFLCALRNFCELCCWLLSLSLRRRRCCIYFRWITFCLLLDPSLFFPSWLALLCVVCAVEQCSRSDLTPILNSSTFLFAAYNFFSGLRR